MQNIFNSITHQATKTAKRSAKDIISFLNSNRHGLIILQNNQPALSRTWSPYRDVFEHKSEAYYACKAKLVNKIRDAIVTFDDQTLTAGEEHYIKAQVAHHIIKRLLDDESKMNLHEISKRVGLDYSLPEPEPEKILAFHERWRTTRTGQSIDLYSTDAATHKLMSQLLEAHVLEAIETLDIKEIVRASLTSYRAQPSVTSMVLSS